MLLYEGKDSFLEETTDFKKARYIVLPVPMDITTTYLKGTKFGPRSVVEASRSLENYDLELDFEVKDLIHTTGELEIPPDATEAVDIVRKTISDVIMEKKIPVMIGGEHTITYGASLAFDEDVVFVIFDAHADFKKDVFGSKINHASNSRLICKRNKVVLVGVRSLSIADRNELLKNNVLTFYAQGPVLDKDISKLRKAVSGKKVYVSIDMDVFDPSIAPGVGTPQPGGMHYIAARHLLEELVKDAVLVGFDVNEIRPLGDNNITEILAAKLIIDIISLNEKKTRSKRKN